MYTYTHNTHTNARAHTHVCIYILMYVRMHVCVCVFVYNTCARTHAHHACVYTCMECTCIHVHECMRAGTDAHTHARTRAHNHPRARTHFTARRMCVQHSHSLIICKWIGTTEHADTFTQLHVCVCGRSVLVWVDTCMHAGSKVQDAGCRYTHTHSLSLTHTHSLPLSLSLSLSLSLARSLWGSGHVEH